MRFDFEDPVPIVQTKKKYATFKVTPIGGPEEIIKWRQMQEAKETTYRMRLAAKDARISSFEAELGQKLESPKVKTADWKEKLDFAMSERARLAKIEEVASTYVRPDFEPEPKTVFQRIAGFFKRIWASANF